MWQSPFKPSSCRVFYLLPERIWRCYCWSLCLSGRHWRNKQRDLFLFSPCFRSQMHLFAVPVSARKANSLEPETIVGHLLGGGEVERSRPLWAAGTWTSILAQRSRRDPELGQLLTTARTWANYWGIYCTIALCVLHKYLLCGQIKALWVMQLWVNVWLVSVLSIGNRISSYWVCLCFTIDSVH